jgi:hypothetical protein
MRSTKGHDNMTTADTLGRIAGDVAKGAAGGAAGGPIGMAIGGLIAIVSDIAPGALSSLLGEGAQAKLASAAAAITGVSGETAQVVALAKDPAATEAFRLQALSIAAEQQKADQKAQLAFMAAALERQKVEIADTANARQMGVSYAQAGSKMQWAQPVVSVLVVFGFFLALGGMLFYRGTIDPIVATIINVLVGVLAGNFSQVCNFWLGSSSGSARKTELLATSVPSSVIPAPAALVPAADVEPMPQ